MIEQICPPANSANGDHIFFHARQQLINSVRIAETSPLHHCSLSCELSSKSPFCFDTRLTTTPDRSTRYQIAAPDPTQIARCAQNNHEAQSTIDRLANVSHFVLSVRLMVTRNHSFFSPFSHLVRFLWQPIIRIHHVSF
jgi:hypothetical protein